jgi:hypothetical protein
MNAREVEAAAADLVRSRRRISDAIRFAAAFSVLALATLPLGATVAIAFGGGAAAGALVALTTALARREKVALLALDPMAYELPEVSAYASRLTRRLERERLADWIDEILAEEVHLPGNCYVTHRVIRYAEELAALSDDLADPGAEIRPASAAAAHLLLTQAVDSPLYNPRLPDEQLPAMIANIRLGISRVPACLR